MTVAARLYANNFATTTTGNITNVATTVPVTSVTGLPSITGSNYYLLTLISGANVEIVKVTGVSSLNLTVVRAQEGTTGYAFTSGSTVEMRETAASFTSCVSSDQAPTLSGTLSVNAQSIAFPTVTITDVLSDGTLAANSATKVPTQSAVKTYADAGYRPGGTTVAVTDGGTGIATTTAYAVIAGGTTSTGAFQHVSGVGTSGQVLTSNGASALPTWQAAGSGITWSTAVNASIIPDTTNAYDLGDSTHYFRNVFIKQMTSGAGNWNISAANMVIIPTTNSMISAGAICTENVTGQQNTLKYHDGSVARACVSMTASAHASPTANSILQYNSSDGRWRSPTNFKSDYNLVIGTDIQAFDAQLSQAGYVVQSLVTTDTTGASTNVSMPYASGAPTSSQGVQLFTVAVTPKNASNRLKIEVFIPQIDTSGSEYFVGAIFQDATSAALTAAAHTIGSGSTFDSFALVYEMAAGTTSSTTFKFRFGQGANAATVYAGRTAGSATPLGTAGIMSSIRVTEYHV